MKKFIAGLIVTFSLVNTAYADFLDVSTSNKNYDAIIYLQQNEIIQGYTDGTFRPEQNISRAELLKIILESAKTPLDIEENPPFTDLKYLTWELPYIRKAYSQKWVSGYEDHTFKSSRPITKAESIKIIGEVQDWVLPSNISTQPFEDVYVTAWFTPYISYAKSKDYLEETGQTFYPNEYITRGEVSEIIYRSLGGKPQKISRTAPEEKPTEEQTEQSEQTADPSITYNSTSANFYENISLNSSLPNIFYENEIYVISGEITGTSKDSATVIVDKEDGSKKYTFVNEAVNNKFSIPVYFSDPGIYELGIIPGETGQSKAYKMEVVEGLPEIENTEEPPTIDTPKIKYSKDITKVQINNTPSTFKKLTFTQGSKKAILYNRQDINEIPLNYKAFKNFKEGSVSFYVESAKTSSTQPLEISSDFTKSSVQTFEAVTHSYTKNEKDKISTSPPDTISSVKEISFDGETKTKTSLEAFVTKPDGFVENIDLLANNTYTEESKTYINQNSDFSFSYVPTKKGRYIAEIVDNNGMAVLNYPIYVGNIIPLIPDFFDLTQREFLEGSLSISEARSELLAYINASRQEHGLSQINTTTSLNSLAQAHAKDMADNNYFAHVNLEGESPEDRRIAKGIEMPVSENIAKDVSIIFAHNGLMRSGNHRKNILQKDWEIVGLGIVLKNGYLYVTEEFLTNTTSEADIDNYKDELLDAINEKREEKNISALTYNQELENVAKYLNNKAINENTTLSNDSLSEALDNFNIKGSTVAIGRVYTLWNLILSSIIEQEIALQDSEWERIGIDIRLDNKGFLNTIVIVNTP